MDILSGFVIWFIWTIIAFFAGVIIHWWATRKQRRLLKQYRQQSIALRQWGRPIE